MKKLLVTSNIFALVITVAINYLSNTGFFNGETMKTISESYHNFFTPAGYAFSLWGLIYLALAGFVIYSSRQYLKFKNTNILEKTGWWFVISCAANSAWVIAWLYNYTGLSVLIMLVLLVSLLMIVENTKITPSGYETGYKLFVRYPFALYSGWISVALAANIAAWLTKTGWNGFGISGPSWVVIIITAAGLVNLFMIWKRSMWLFGLTGCWALTAIAVENSGQAPQAAFAAVAAAVILFISSIIKALEKRTAAF